MDKLRDEIIEAQKSRSELLKWKLVIVSVLGAAGLGLSDKHEAILIVLALIPLASLYVDVVCYHLALRSIVIGSFLRSFVPKDSGNMPATLEIYHNYEKFAFATRGKNIVAFDLEDWALWQSTLFLSIFVWLAVAYDILFSKEPSSIPADFCLAISGAIGIRYSRLLFTRFKQKSAALGEVKAEYFNN